MSESPSSQTQTCSTDPCPHANLTLAIGRLSQENGLMEQTIYHIRASNRLAQYNNRWLKVVTYMFAVSLVLLIGVVLLAWRIFSDVAVVEQRLREAVTNIEELSQRIEQTEKKLGEVKKDTEEAKKAREASSTIELVPEKDPSKARYNPVKVRIIPPKHPDPPASTVEVPLPVRNAVKVSPRSGE